MANKGHQVVVPRIQYSKYEYKVVRKLIDQNIAKEPLHLVREELADYKDLLLRFIRENLGGVENYLRFVTTKDHFRAKLLDSLSQISSTDTAIQTEKESILQEVTRLDQMVPPVDEYEYISQVEVPDICWSTLVIDVFSELVHREKIIGTAEFESLQVKLERNTVWDLSGIDIFDPTSNCWQGRLRVKNGLLYGLVEAVVPNDKFDRAILEGGSLRRVVLQSDTTCDMVQVVSLMECSGSLERIEFLTKESTILSRIATIRNNYGHNTCPLELIFSNQQKTTLARLTIGHSVDSQVVDTGPYEPITPPIDVLEWNLDRVHEPMQDSCAQVLDDASRQHPSILVNFTLDMTALTAQGFLHIGKVLQQSALECLHVKCVSFRPFQEERIAKVLQAIRWPTIKSLILTGNNIDDWLQLWVRHAGLHDSVGVWADSSASGPSLVSLRIRGHEKNKSNLSHASALAIHYLVYSCRLVELRVENILLENKEEWQMVLDGIHYSSLRSVSLQGSNISDSQRRKAVTKKSLLHIKDRVGGWIRKKL
ncbi:hypothetical protein BGZ52_010505 [Haplosporangium bisporale]|nr:hypothetical protein BGZ52_010505 [Haplosporangium bisporale]